MDKVILEEGGRIARAIPAARAARGKREPLGRCSDRADARVASLFCVVILDEREQAFRTL
jgi:hypothetical protein